MDRARSGYGKDRDVTDNNNYTGAHPGDWIDALNQDQCKWSLEACFNSSDNFYTSVSSSLNSYSQKYLKAALAALNTGDGWGTVGAVFQAVADAGWNPSKSYGSNIQSVYDKFIVPRINCDK